MLTIVKSLRSLPSRLVWPLARLLHRLDFDWVLPALASLPITMGHRLARWRGRLNAATGRDWRSMALGFRHIRTQSALGYQSLPVPASEPQVSRWVRERFIAEARDEFEARLVAGHRVDELACEALPAGALSQLVNRERGLVLLTPHFESFFLGVAFLARSGVKVNLMTSAVTHDPRVDAAVQRHFTAKYRGLESYLNGGRAIDLELGARQFYRMLQNKEALVILGDAPVLPDGAAMSVRFLGGSRRLSGGPLRMAQSTGSDLGGYLCRHLGAGQYRLELSAIGAAADPATVAEIYRFFSHAILDNPGGWWAADLLPNMPIVVEAPAPTVAAAPPPSACHAGPEEPAPDLIRGHPWIAGQARNDTPPLPCHAGLDPASTSCHAGLDPASTSCHAGLDPASSHETLLLIDSPLADSPELALGLRQLRTQLCGNAKARWHEALAAEVPPAHFLGLCADPYLLVLLQPALLATASLPAELQACLALGGACCAVAADQRSANGEWSVGYTSQVDFERYVARRQSLPGQAPWDGGSPCAYLVDVASARELVNREPGLAWQDLPRAFGPRTVMAPRAFVHSYSDYQQGAREEMLELLPASVHRLLDVGGGEGHFARSFIEQRGGEAWLVEPSPAAGKAQPHDKLRVFQGRLEDIDPRQAGLFDAVSFLDVLEHMTEPLEALRNARRLLRPGGLLLVSVPNVGHWSIVRDLALGRFDYLPVGILCGTHLRFFTARSLEQLLGEAGFEVVRWRRAGPAMPEEFARFMAASAQAQLAWDTESLQTESLHVLAALR